MKLRRDFSLVPLSWGPRITSREGGGGSGGDESESAG
jgi:hypothetical protein